MSDADGVPPVYENGLVVVVTGNPAHETEDGYSTHNCDAMGFGQDHVLRREPIERLADVLSGAVTP